MPEALAGSCFIEYPMSIYWFVSSSNLTFQVLAILDKIKEEKKGAERKEQSDSSAVHKEDSEWDDEDPDQGIIYVE